MSHGHCSCPECGTILRIRDRSFVGRQIPCPECDIPLEIKLTDDRDYVAFHPAAAVPSPKDSAPRKRVAVPATRIRSAFVQRIASLLRSPLFMAWALAVGITTFAAVVMLRPTVRFLNRKPSVAGVTPSPSPPTSEQPEQVESSNPDEEFKPQPDAAPTASINPVLESPKLPAPDSIPEKGGEPSASNVPSKQAPPDTKVAVDAANPTKPALDPTPRPVVAPPIKINIEPLLEQRLLKFVTKEPISRLRLIDQVEEMLGAPVRYNRDELGEKNLELTININLENTTVGGVLKALLDSAGWEFVIEETGLRLRPRQATGPQ